MTKLPIYCVLCGFTGLLAPPAYGESSLVDLIGDAIPEPGSVTALSAADLDRLRDGDASTIVTFPVVDGQPVALVFKLPGELTAPEEFLLTLGRDGYAPVETDLLVSELSGTLGFSSVRTERIDSLSTEVRFRFAPQAARWAMVRLTPAAGADYVTIADLQLNGRDGPPASAYAFDQSPAEAIELIRGLQDLGTDGIALSAQEETLFAQTENGAMSVSQFEQLALHASGVTSTAERDRFADQITALEVQLRAEVDVSGSATQTGAVLLDWLHNTVLTNGYEEGQTNLSDLLSSGVYNCVSSAVIYAALGQRLGLDVRAIEVPDHAFAILYDGVNHSDVETTTQAGFDPSRDRQAAFEQLTGYTYIPQSNKAKRREIGLPGLAALICYNHGVSALEEDRYADALVANFRALSLDPEFDSAIKNAMVALGRWSVALADDGQWEEAVRIADIGVSLAPEDRGLVSRRETVWRLWAQALSQEDDREGALAILDRAIAHLPEAADAFSDAQAYLFVESGEALIDTGDWPKALAAADASGYELTPQAHEVLRKWQRDVYLRWSNHEISEGNLGTARDILGLGLQHLPDDPRLSGNIRYVAQEGAFQADDFSAGLAFLEETLSAFPHVPRLHKTAEIFVAQTLSDPARVPDIGTGLALVAQAAPIFADPEIAARLGASIYERHGHPLIDAGDWSAAAEIYAAGRNAYPNARILTTNARYIAQQWQRSALESGGPNALAEVNAKLRTLFPDFAGAGDFGEGEVRRQVAELADASEFTAAQDALDAAQLVLSADTYQEMSVYIVDREARVSMDAGNWDIAAEVYAAALARFPGESHLSRNAIYVAQEWTRHAAESGGADALSGVMGRLEDLFPGNEKIAEMGATTLRRAVLAAIDARQTDEARSLLSRAKGILTPERAQDLTVTFFQAVAQNQMAVRDWPAAMETYAQGLALYPDERPLSRNLQYIAQEWIADSYASEGMEGIIAVVPVIASHIDDQKSLDRTLESLVGREASAVFAEGDAEGALALIDSANPALSSDATVDLKVYIYDQWARQIGEGGDWPAAIAIYDSAIAELGDIRILANNRRWAASQ